MKNLIKKVKSKIINDEKVLRLSIKIIPTSSYLYLKLAKTLHKQNKWNQEIDTLKAAIKFNHTSSELYYRLAYAQEKMNLISAAEESFRNAIVLDHNEWKYYSALAKNLHKQNKSWEEVDALKHATEINNTSAKIYYRLARAQEKMNHFSDAVASYGNAIELYEKHTEWMYFYYGYALQKIGQEESAKEAFAQAIKLDTSMNSQELGIGVFHEKRSHWIPSLEAYKEKSKEEPENALLYYRLGVSYDRNYDWGNAKKSIEYALSLDSTNAHWFYRLGFVCERIKKWEEAEDAYNNALERAETFTSSWFYRLGYVLNKQGKYQEANEAFLEQRVLQDAHGVSETSYSENINLRKVIDYTEYYERFKLDDKTILYESYHGHSISCNPYAIFRSLLKNKKFKNYKHIWIINDKSKIPKDLKSNNNIVFIRRDCDLYMRYLTNTRYLINNSTFPDYYIRKEDQVYLNTWHGTPLKHVGKDIKNDFVSHENVTRNFLQATHLIQPNAHTADILLASHDVDGIYSGIVAETGYPKQDLMLNISYEEKNKLYSILNISVAKKVVLYSPAGRGIFKEADFDTTQLKEVIRTVQEIENMQLLFRGHYAVEQEFNDLDLDITIIPSCIDTNSLLSIVDILITDYSSISFDFMALSRPIIYYMYDREKYENERGLYFSIDILGGEMCTNSTELKMSLSEVVLNDKINITQREAREQFCPNDDGKATNRVIDLVFFEAKTNIKLIEYKQKESILFYGGGFFRNGITSSLINLLEHIDTSKYYISIIINQNDILNDEQRLEQFSKLNKDIKINGRVGRMLMTLEEHWIRNKFDSQRTLASDEMWHRYKILFKREYKRMFSNGKFDYVIDFTGYSIFWSSVFAFQPNNSIYLHSDMLGEWSLKYPTLENIFKLYQFYKTLISVSEQSIQQNIDNLSDTFDLDKNSFTYCDNIQSPEEILTGAKEDFENKNDEKIFDNTKVFINIARLSPEKGQEKLIMAFEKVSKIHPEARLVILGGGSLEHYLHHLVRNLGLEKKVFFLGYKFNPMPYLDRSDCMVLSSNYEGQGIVLLEAMILQKAIISTDTPGPRGVLKENFGLLVENSEDGLYNGMIDYLDGKYTQGTVFDYGEYNQNALTMFYKNIINAKEKR